MRSFTFIRGAAFTGALLLAQATGAYAAAPADTSTSTGTTTSTTPAAENTPLHLGSGSVAHASGGGAGPDIIRTVVGLFIVIAVIYGISWILRQVKASKTRAASGEGLEQVASLPLGSNRSLALVRVGRELMLIGVAEHRVDAIRKYNESEALEQGLELTREKVDPARDSGVPIEPLSNQLIDRLRRLTVRQ
jgi:flagellar protein FliO/FliZ